jgi:Protein of unknown function (DUF2878)
VSWVNLLGYQLTWFVTVGSVSHGRAWIGMLTALLFCAGHVLPSRWRMLDLRLIASSLLLGALLDGALATAGLVRYTAPLPAVPLLSCPLWILGLWAAFATTLTRSLGWLRDRPWAATVFGAVGGPLAYLAAERGWSVVTLSDPIWLPLLSLASGWAVALAILIRSATGGAAVEVARDRLREADFP